MSTPPAITIVQPNPDGSLPIPAPAAPSATEAAAAQLQQRAEALQEQLEGLQELLDKPLNEILADRDKALEAASAWDAFGAMWMLSQRAMRRVAMDLAAQQGVSEAEVVARAMQHANAVLNTEDETLGGSMAPAQLAHIARHRPYLRKQFRQG
jgi:cell division septum initiation protein DivIVA